KIGSPVSVQTGFYLSLGQRLELDIRLDANTLVLPAVETREAADALFSRSRMGAEALLSDSLIHRTPVINRDLYDLIRLVPQTSTWFAVTSSGAGPRVNDIRIDGVGDQVPSSNLAA